MGDVVNTSVQKRFSESDVGRKINMEYEELRLNHSTPEDLNKCQNRGPELKNILDDETLMRLMLDIRKWGYESFLLPQNHELPFGYTRQDILVKRW